ncbi:MAG TPA: PAS domain S-box protein, partial [Kiloniellaceae bacterium]|nr:PAS domain S-box protein [Kiloniellaceae bacterium]
MSKPRGFAAASPRRVAAALQAVAGPAALASGGQRPAELRLVGANRAFAEAAGCEAAALAGRGLAEVCGPRGRSGETIELRPLYDRNGRRLHWLVLHRQSAAPAGGTARGATPTAAARDGDFRSLVENIGNGVLVHRDFRPLYANAACARRIGFADGAMLLREPTLLPFLPFELHRLAQRRHARLLAGEPPGPARVLRCLTRDGEPFWAEATEQRILWEGEPAVLVSLIDVTEQVQMRRTELMLR